MKHPRAFCRAKHTQVGLAYDFDVTRDRKLFKALRNPPTVKFRLILHSHIEAILQFLFTTRLVNKFGVELIKFRSRIDLRFLGAWCCNFVVAVCI